MRDEFKSYCREGAYPSIVINNRDDLTKKETIKVMESIKKTIQSESIKGYDCDAVGAKNLECNWGFCGDRKDHYPDPDMHTFPQDFVDNGRISHLNPAIACPLRYKHREGRGCFYDCVFFSRKKNPDKGKALILYDNAINKLKKLDD